MHVLQNLASGAGHATGNTCVHVAQRSATGASTVGIVVLLSGTNRGPVGPNHQDGRQHALAEWKCGMNTRVHDLVELLSLKRSPVAITFCDRVPEGMTHVDAPALSGCTYWKFAAEGNSFYTDAGDHYGCPVGSYTHGIDLPPEKQQELEGLIGTMVQLTYIDPAEVPEIPRRSQPFRYAVYAPLTDAKLQPDVVLISGNARQMMILAEAAHAAGVDCETSMVGRPTCAAIPAVMQSGRSATNLGCIGNRVYTDLPDDELYFAISAAAIDRLLDKLGGIANANVELEKFHRARVSTS